MAQWKDGITVADTLGVSSLLDGLSTLATAANATLDAGGAALNVAKVFLAGTASPQAAAASALVETATGIVNDLFGAGFFQVVVHPWTPGVSRGTGPFRGLDFPRCARLIRDSLDDAGDAARPQFSPAAPVELVAIIAGAPSPEIFRTTLAALESLLNLKELRLARRRIDQAFELDAQRFTRPRGSTPPDWQSVTAREALPALAPLEDALKENLALLEGYAAGGETAVDAALALVTRKQAQLTTLQNRLNAAAALFGQGIQGAGVYALHLSGTGGNDFLKAGLDGATDAPGRELSFCAGVAWVAPQGGLATIADLLGI